MAFGKTLVLSLQSLSPMFAAVEVEVISRELAEGREVHLLTCGERLPTCSLNPTHNLLGCATCQHRSVHFAERAGVPRTNFHRLDPRLFPSRFTGVMPANLTELLELEHNGFNIGRGAASSSITILREYNVDPQGEHRELVELELRTSIGALLNYEKILDQLQPERVYLFNGRHSELFPMVDLCRQRGIWFACEERGANDQRYHLFKNNLPHSIKSRRETMEELWAAADATQKAAKASDWYERKRKGVAKDDRSYIDGQEQGALPVNWKANRHNIVVFNSSEDEMKTIREWDTDLFDNQNDVILGVAESLREREDIHLYVRMHPNLAVVDNQQTQQLYSLAQKNVTVIGPREKIDSYHLSEAADVILTFASTIGIEATYWGTASVLYGRALYEDMGATYEPKSFAELLQNLMQRGLPPKPRENTFIYGYFVSHYGEAFQFAEVRTPADVTLLGEPVRRMTLPAFLKFLGYLPQIGRWRRTHKIITGSQLKLSQLTKLYSHLREKA